MNLTSRLDPQRRPILKSQKRGDLMVEEIKRWVASSELKLGGRLPKESELQKLFSVSKGTAREALKSLEVQGLVTLKSGPEGGATLSAVTFDRTVQLVQNYFFFQTMDIEGIYALRRLLEPELVAGAVPYLTAAAIQRLEDSVESCTPAPSSRQHGIEQRQEDLHFHDILAEANPNTGLRFFCQLLNEMMRRMVVFHGQSVLGPRFVNFGKANVRAHRAIIDAVRARDADRTRTTMLNHIVEAEKQVRQLKGVFHSRLLLDSETKMVVAPPLASKPRSRK